MTEQTMKAPLDEETVSRFVELVQRATASPGQITKLLEQMVHLDGPKLQLLLEKGVFTELVRTDKTFLRAFNGEEFVRLLHAFQTHEEFGVFTVPPLEPHELRSGEQGWKLKQNLNLPTGRVRILIQQAPELKVSRLERLLRKVWFPASECHAAAVLAKGDFFDRCTRLPKSVETIVFAGTLWHDKRGLPMAPAISMENEKKFICVSLGRGHSIRDLWFASVEPVEG